jgi:chemotaxis protein MotA
MKQSTAIGMGMAVAVLLLSVIMEGGNPASLLNIPALLIVGGGTFGATLSSTSFALAKGMPKLAILAIKGEEIEPTGVVPLMVRLAEKARREGVLALEDELQQIEDPFTRKGLQLVVDGADSEIVEAILGAEIETTQARHLRNSNLFQTAGGFAPTLGILGTVLSLVHVLENLSSPSTLGHSIAGAFLATLYGVGSANLMLLPIGNRLKEMSAREVAYRELLLEAILSIQAGDNPRMLEEKLQSFLSPAERETAKEPAAAPAVAAASAAAEVEEAAA